MKRKFVTNLILLLFLNLLIKPFWIFGIDRTVQNMVGAESYGLYFSLLNFSLLLNILLDLGITNFNNRNIAQNSHLLKKSLTNIVGVKFLLAVVYAVVCLLTAALIGYNKLQLHLLLFLIFNQFLISFTLYLRSNISGLHLFRTDSLLSVLDRSLMIVFCSLLLFTPRLAETFSISWFVYAQTAAYVLTAIITYLTVLHYAGTFRMRLDWHNIRLTLKQSFPYALLILLMAFYNRIDSVLLERLLPGSLGKEQAGIYAQAFRLLDALAMFGALFAGLLLPIFARMIKQGENPSPLVQFAFRLLIVPAILVAVASIFYAQPIMSLLYHEHIELSAPLLGILMTGFTGIATTYIFGTLLTANGSLKQLNQMALAGVVLNVSLNLLLIPQLQALGSAYASLTTQLLTAMAQVVIATRLFQFKVDYLLLLKLLGFVLFCILAAKASLFLNDRLLGFALLLLSGVAYAFLSRLISIKAFVVILKDQTK
ncbi:oligosaccharide flippase family protein [uncultured Sunxiuqinia sp.]|uniref:oligosaccharide flippase family protein n=1 Tax=uncultured Sunxiuqinia sp. TaxID=1573825 RepID=UPI002626737A|nr:oligosaccharide flippase family protein [uncultured Sunxiuqinia sp.]